MSRAERRRNDRNKKKSVKTYNMTAESLASLREAEYQKARKDIMGKVDDVYRQIFVMMLAIPTNILISDYWKKSSKKRIPKFVDECLNLYEAWMSGAVDVGDMVDMVEEYAGIKLVDYHSATWDVLFKNGQIREQEEQA